MATTVVHFGGNGHASARLEPARAALAARGDGPVELVDVPYPGFEGRPRAGSLDAFLDAVGGFVAGLDPAPRLGIASGIGALIALGLRARGELADLPLVFQGPVLWGLEHRAFPRLMRWRLPRRLLGLAFGSRRFQDRFVRKQFLRPLDPALRDRFFEGYRTCSAFEDFFEWFTPAYLRGLERAFADRPGALGGITVWVGGKDHVVGRAEVEATERAIPARWPVVEHANWGHYPLIDAPGEWADALCHAVATAA